MQWVSKKLISSNSSNQDFRGFSLTLCSKTSTKCLTFHLRIVILSSKEQFYSMLNLDFIKMIKKMMRMMMNGRLWKNHQSLNKLDSILRKSILLLEDKFTSWVKMGYMNMVFWMKDHILEILVFCWDSQTTFHTFIIQQHPKDQHNLSQST